MLFKKTALILSAFSMVGLSGCQVVKATGKVAALPFQAVYKTGEFTGKGVLKTGEIAGKSVFYTGKGIYETGKFAGKSAAAVGKAVYYIGNVPVTITDKALDTTSKVLTITTQAADATGKIMEVSRNIQSLELDAELKAIKGATNVIGVFVDAFTRG